MNVDKQMEALGDSINEMLASTAAVKGQAFADAVAVNFEAVQLMSMVDRLVALADEDDRALAVALHTSCMDLASSIAAKACDGISDEDLQEVMKMGRALNKRRNDAAAEIMKGMGGE